MEHCPPPNGQQMRLMCLIEAKLVVIATGTFSVVVRGRLFRVRLLLPVVVREFMGIRDDGSIKAI